LRKLFAVVANSVLLLSKRPSLLANVPNFVDFSRQYFQFVIVVIVIVMEAATDRDLSSKSKFFVDEPFKMVNYLRIWLTTCIIYTP